MPYPPPSTPRAFFTSKLLLVLLALLVVLPLLAGAQVRKPVWHSTLDSLQALEREPQTDSSRIQLLCRISDQLWASDTEAAARYSRQALALARRTHNRRGEGAALNRLGAALRESNLARALELFQSSLRLAQQAQDTALQAQNMRSIGIIYVYLRDRQLGLSYYFQGLRLDSLLRDERRIVVDLSNIGLAYDLYNQMDSAAYYQERAYNLAQRLHSSTNYILYGLGNVARKQARFPEALGYYRRSVAESKRRRHLRSLNFSYLGMAALYQQLQQADSSIYYARLGAQAARANGFLRGVLNASAVLTQEFEQRGQLDSAFHYQKTLVAMKDTLFGQEKVMRLQNVNYQDRQRDQEAAAAHEALRNRYQTYGLLAGVGGLLLLLGLLVRHDRQQHRTNVALQTSLGELKEAQLMLVQREKMAFLGELTAGVAHELQNPLSFVRRFAEVSTSLVDEINGAQQLARDGRLEREILDGLKQNLQNISQHGQRATAIIKGMLEHARTGQQARQLTNLNQLSQENLQLAYEAVQQQFPGFQAELRTEFATDLPPAAAVAPDLGRVLLNLCTNALYAVRQCQRMAGPDYQPAVEVGSRRLPDGQLQLWVRDNGAGMSLEVQQRIFEPFFTTKPVGEGTGLGLSLAHDIVVNGHQGTVRVESTEGKGATFLLTLPG